MLRTLLGWSTLSGHLSEPPFTKSWIYSSCVSACWHVCLTTCVPVCTSECLHVFVWMTACLHICIFAGLSLYPHVCISWCVHVCVSAWLHTCTCLLCVCVHEKGCYVCMSVWVADWEKNPLWVGASDGGLTCCTTLLADLWSCCPHIKVLLFLITIWLKLDVNLGQKTENYHLQEKFKWQRLLQPLQKTYNLKRNILRLS